MGKAFGYTKLTIKPATLGVGAEVHGPQSRSLNRPGLEHKKPRLAGNQTGQSHGFRDGMPGTTDVRKSSGAC